VAALGIDAGVSKSQVSRICVPGLDDPAHGVPPRPPDTGRQHRLRGHRKPRTLSGGPLEGRPPSRRRRAPAHEGRFCRLAPTRDVRFPSPRKGGPLSASGQSWRRTYCPLSVGDVRQGGHA
jgi:hypothetical protein